MSQVIAPQWTYGPARGQTTDPEFNNVKLLLPMELNFLDASKSQQTVTRMNGISINTGISKFGGGSGAFSGTHGGTNQYLDITNNSDFNLSNVNFTFEAWVYVSSVVRQFLLAGGNNDHFAYQIEFPSSGAINFFGSGDIGGIGTAASVVQSGQWFHVAVVRNTTTIKIFYNGVEKVSSDVSTGSFGTGMGPIQIGVVNNTSFPLNGYINGFRYTKNVARYTASFTPPTQAFPTSGP